MALFIGAITSAVSVLEVVAASVIDEWKLSRRAAALGTGMVIAALGVAPALVPEALTVADALASEVFLPLGALLLALLVAWRIGNATALVADGASPRVQRLLGGWFWTLRIAVPPLLVLVLWQTVPPAVRGILGAFGVGR